MNKLPDWAIEHFANPQTWKPFTIRHALAMQVLCVAHTRVEGCWSAYCDAVPGWDHALEQEAVLQRGEKLEEKVALAIFPQFTGIPYAG